MISLELDMIQSAGLGALALFVGMILTRKIPFLQKFCVPSPVSGGIIFSLITLALYVWFDVEVSFVSTLQDVFMMAFFTSVGFQCDLKVIRQGGKLLGFMLILLALNITLQNLMPLGLTRLMGVDPLVGMAAGSIPMTGGHGTSGGFAPVLEEMGLQGAASITMACATFGLVAGSLIGGPIAERIIRRHHLAPESHSTDVVAGMESNTAAPDNKKHQSLSEEKTFRGYAKAVYILVLTMALGVGLSKLLVRTGITFPTYFGSLIVACIIRNVCEGIGKGRDMLGMDKITSLGNICLSLFLGIAMATLKLWELASLVLPLCVILLAQMAFIALYSRFVAFNVLGKDYDAAVLVSGLCGFGLGATPNAMANMSAVCFKYRYATVPFIIVPIIGAMFSDLINTGIITVFLNLLP